VRVELAELLAEREIIHPTKIDSVMWANDELVISATGFPWWERAHLDRKLNGRIRLIFSGIDDGVLRPDEINAEDDEALEDFEVVPVAQVDWAQPKRWSVFCSGPVPEPMALYVRLHDYLARRRAFLLPEAFLNHATEISRFIEMAHTPGFKLGQGPECVRALLCAELERQGVTYNVVPTPADEAGRWLVRLGGSSFLCRSAAAEFELVATVASEA
jgi:hypothetical protein